MVYKKILNESVIGYICVSVVISFLVFMTESFYHPEVGFKVLCYVSIIVFTIMLSSIKIGREE